MAEVNEIRKRIDAACDKRKRILDEVDRLANRAGELSSGEQTRLDQQIVGVRAKGELEALEQEWRAAMRAGIADGSLQKLRGDGSDSFEHMRRVDPWAERSYYDSPGQVRDRGLAAVEQMEDRGVGVAPEDRDRVSMLIREEGEDDGTHVAEYVVASSRPSYASAFAKAMRGRETLWTDEEKNAVLDIERTKIRQESRAALSTTGQNGGFMIPFFLDPTWIYSNAGAVNPFRRICRVELIPTNVWHRVSSAGVVGEWTSEASEVTDASPVFTQPTKVLMLERRGPGPGEARRGEGVWTPRRDAMADALRHER